jgi:hypothetical protein
MSIATTRPEDYRTVARYETFVLAEQASDHLRENGVPAEHVTIVGRGLNAPAAAGRLVGWRSAGRAGLVGALVGAVLGWLLATIHLLQPAVGYLVLSGAAAGALVGAVSGLARYHLRTTRRELTTISGVTADSYQVQVDAKHVDPKRAERRLARYWPM